MARENDISFLHGEQIAIPTGATAARFITPYPGEVASILKNYPGGSFEILPAPPGNTMQLNQFTSQVGTSLGFTLIPQTGVTVPVSYLWAGASLINMSGTGYGVGINETVNISGPARYYINNLSGATFTIQRLVAKAGW
jgi:hypothetical protein